MWVKSDNKLITRGRVNLKFNSHPGFPNTILMVPYSDIDGYGAPGYEHAVAGNH